MAPFLCNFKLVYIQKAIFNHLFKSIYNRITHTPHLTTLHHTTPHYTTPHHTTPHHTTPHHTTPHHTTPHHTTPHHTTHMESFLCIQFSHFGIEWEILCHLSNVPFFTGNAEGLREKYVNQEVVEVALHMLYN